MSLTKAIRSQLNRLQSYAATYFELIFKTSFNFWELPSLPSGANILNGAFAIILITMARAQMSQSTEASTVAAILIFVLFIVLLVSGILIVFDRKIYGKGQAERVSAWRKLVAVISTTITLGCAFIILDKVFPWIGVIFILASRLEWGIEAANRFVASVAGLLACGVILANTIYRTSRVPIFRNFRILVWTAIIFGIVIIGINLLVTTSNSYW